jgi:hypothetical protein
MNTSRSIFRFISILVLVLMMSGMASASPLSVISPGTAFTYQGRLSNGGTPANGSYDLRFKLFTDPTTGSPIGTVDKGGVTVTNGLFTVLLDFGDVFDGTPLYLEVSVGPGYTPLLPRQALTPTPYAIYASKVPWSGIAGKPGNIIVVAKTGGDFNTIQAALASIPTTGLSAPSGLNPYLIYVAPGVYTEQVTMKSFVDIQGSGELTTRITFTGGSGTNTSTLLGANNAELRFLTVENTGGTSYAIAIINKSTSPRLTNITASASGGTYNYGVYNFGNSASMTNVTASASGGTGINYGVYNTGANPTMTNVTASASGATSQNFGVFNTSSSSPTMTNVIASAGEGVSSTGVENVNSSATINNSVISGIYCGIYNYGSSGDNTVVVNNSQIIGPTTISTYSFFTIRIGNSQLSGGAVDTHSGGTITCAGVYDESFTFYPSTCT